jgi:hypothetical protein
LLNSLTLEEEELNMRKECLTYLHKLGKGLRGAFSPKPPKELHRERELGTILQKDTLNEQTLTNSYFAEHENKGR